jgi:hypothetical protein
MIAALVAQLVSTTPAYSGTQPTPHVVVLAVPVQAHSLGELAREIDSRRKANSTSESEAPVRIA